jgi:hypothetical protein
MQGLSLDTKRVTMQGLSLDTKRVSLQGLSLDTILYERRNNIKQEAMFF